MILAVGVLLASILMMAFNGSDIKASLYERILAAINGEEVGDGPGEKVPDSDQKPLVNDDIDKKNPITAKSPGEPEKTEKSGGMKHKKHRDKSAYEKAKEIPVLGGLLQAAEDQYNQHVKPHVGDIDFNLGGLQPYAEEVLDILNPIPDLYSITTGKDWESGEELGEHERVLKPTANYLIGKKFKGGGKVVAKLDKKIFKGYLAKKYKKASSKFSKKKKKAFDWYCNQGFKQSSMGLHSVNVAYASGDEAVLESEIIDSLCADSRLVKKAGDKKKKKTKGKKESDKGKEKKKETKQDRKIKKAVESALNGKFREDQIKGKLGKDYKKEKVEYELKRQKKKREERQEKRGFIYSYKTDKAGNKEMVRGSFRTHEYPEGVGKDTGAIRYKSKWDKNENKVVETVVEVKKGNGKWKKVFKSEERRNQRKSFEIKDRWTIENMHNAPWLDGKDRVGKKIEISFDKHGFPDFTEYSIPEAEMTLEPEHWLKDRQPQFKILNKELAERIDEDKKLKNALIDKGYSNKDFKNLENGKDLPGMTWHHHQEHGRMQLVESDVHDVARHIGGDAIWGNK